MQVKAFVLGDRSECFIKAIGPQVRLQMRKSKINFG